MFHQNKCTIAQNITAIKPHCVEYDLTDHKSFYKVSESRIMMAVCHGSGKNKGKIEVVYYDGVMENEKFVIKDAEPKTTPVWFDSQALFDDFIEKEGLTSARFSPCRTMESVPELGIDDSVPKLWEEFKKLEKERIKKGCWVTEFIDKSVDEYHTAEGDICKNATWKDYFEWLIDEIETVIEGELSDIEILSIEYSGIDDEEYFAS